MENIRQALERARALNTGGSAQIGPAASNSSRQQSAPDIGIKDPVDGRSQEVALDARHLETHRIIAHDDTDFRSKSFDMLRTQVLQSMDQKNWQILGVTSPTPGCGKTVTAINLALSIARQPERSVLLVDLDLQKPQIANCLGVNCETGVISVLEGRTGLSSTIIPARAGNCRIMALPTESSKSDSSAWMSSRAMSTMLQEIKREYRSHVVIVDLPPMLSSDDVIAVLPQLDCVLFVAAVGKSTVAEIEECNRHLQSTTVVRLVLNKVPQLNTQYYGYYNSKPRPLR
jgi:Mrp family chromosome partitioning ATPase